MKKRWIASAVLLALVLAAGAFWSAGYDAQEEARLAMAQGETMGRVTALGDETSEYGLIFYPGGLVDHAAYAPLMQAMADRGILCLLVQMPLDLAVLDIGAAEGLTDGYPQVSRWIIGGHSLGGAMAASYAAKHPGAFEGLLLLGAYAAEDVRGSVNRVLSIYGSEDGVLNRSKYEESRRHYPAEFTEVVIDGGNHAGFGCYGAQKGDGIAAIAQEEQWAAAAQETAKWLGL